MKNKLQIYSDMDGVIADFDSQFMSIANGLTPADFEKEFGTKEFWGIIDKSGREFWENIPWMEDGREYWDYIDGYSPILLSAPSRNPTSREGKKLWVDNHLPGVPLKLEYSWEKRKFASSRSILIDDREINVMQWTKAGGIGILHTSTISTIKQLKKLGL